MAKDSDAKATEIERKFLVRNDGWRARADVPHLLQQTYLHLFCNDRNSVRVRLIDGCSARLAIKFRSLGRLAKDEYKYEISVDEAHDLILHSSGHIIEKTRYRVPHDGRTWDVDVFVGAYEGLTLAEIEMASENSDRARRNSNRAMAAALPVSPLSRELTA